MGAAAQVLSADAQTARLMLFHTSVTMLPAAAVQGARAFGRRDE